MNLEECLQIVRSYTLARKYVMVQQGKSLSESKTTRAYVNQIAYIQISQKKKSEFVTTTTQDPVLQKLRQVVLKRWPDTRAEVHTDVPPYWNYREEIESQDDLLYRSERLIVPAALRSDMLKLIHQGHLGMVKCKSRAREVLFWPQMNAQIET